MAIVDEGNKQRAMSTSSSSSSSSLSANYTIDRSRVTLIDFPSAGFHSGRQAWRIIVFSTLERLSLILACAIDFMGI